MNKSASLPLWLLMAALLLLPVSSPAQGDPERGKALYVGMVDFAAGGAPCLACHGIAGYDLGHAGNASYGPDLTQFFANYTEMGVAAVLEDPAFPSMAAIYAERPLTEAERTDLLAFFKNVPSDGAADNGAALARHVLIGTLLIPGLIGILGWRRLQGVRRPLVARASSRKGEKA
ncbi:MAG TPA: hypothetical protein VJ910_07435 [Desulfuromonadales bacterium]|nr:hypothetical protein [Desulfuromonadales bacterium]